MSEVANPAIVRAWLEGLSLRCAPTRSQEDYETRLGVFAPALARDLPTRAFTEATLEAISRKFELFPSYAALRRELERWLDANPLPRALPAPDTDLSRAEQLCVGAWQGYRSGAQPLQQGVTLAHVLSMLRLHKPAAFQHIVRVDPIATEIAIKHDWLREPITPSPDASLAIATARARPVAALTEGSPPRSTARPAGDAADGILGVGAHPIRLPRDSMLRFEARHGRKPGQLSDAALHQIRMADPALRPLAERIAAAKARATPHPLAGEPSPNPPEPPA